MNSQTFDRLSKAFAGFCVLYLLAYLFLFIRGSLLYFGEAISYEGLIRTLHGLPFASGPEEIPLSLTPYTPLFLLPLMGLGKIFSISQIETLTVVARLVQIAFLGTLFGLLNALRKRFFSELSSGWAFSWVLIPVFFYSPTMELGLRPDTLSFLCEAGSVYAMLSFLQNGQSKKLILAALLSGLAVSIKLNTLGAAAGLSVFCFFYLDKKQFATFSSIAASVVLIFLGLQYLVLGEALPQNILTSIQSTLLSGGEALKVYMKLFDLFLFPFIYYFFLVLYGLSALPPKREKSLFAWVLSFSFLFAFVGQLKWGAFHNYFLGVIYLGLIPSSIGLNKFLKNKNSPQKTGFLLFHFLYIALFMARGTSIPFKIWQDRHYFSELKQIRTLVEEKAPTGYIYSNDEQMQIAFAHRTAVGVLSQELLQVTPKLQPRIPQVKKNLEVAGPISAYIFKCEDYDSGRSTGIFVDLGDLKKRQRIQTGNYCLLF
jgi:hypothetical protein